MDKTMNEMAMEFIKEKGLKEDFSKFLLNDAFGDVPGWGGEIKRETIARSVIKSRLDELERRIIPNMLADISATTDWEEGKYILDYLSPHQARGYGKLIGKKDILKELLSL